LSACGVSLVESFAEDEGYTLRGVEATISGIRDTEHPENYQRIEMEFMLEGVTGKQARELVDGYKGR